MKHCNELFYESGLPVAVCKEAYGVEHDHGDRTISDRLQSGAAAAFDASDTTVNMEVWFLHGEIAQMRVLDNQEVCKVCSHPLDGGLCTNTVCIYHDWFQDSVIPGDEDAA